LQPKHRKPKQADNILECKNLDENQAEPAAPQLLVDRDPLLNLNNEVVRASSSNGDAD